MAEQETPVPAVARVKLLRGEFAARFDRIEAYRVELPPGQQAGAHLHPGGVVGCVLAGEIAFAIDGQPEQTLRPGDAFYEPPGATIARFDNRSTSEAATFIAFYPLAGEQPLITML